MFLNSTGMRLPDVLAVLLLTDPCLYVADC